MSLDQVGEFHRRRPEHFQMHSNAGETAPKVVVPCHAHTFGHMRILYASDTPGPDGRVGFWETAESPIRDDVGAIIGWHEERNHHIRANGPDSAVWIPAGWRHEFRLLSMTGYHECYSFMRNAEDEKTQVFEGYTHGAT